jgi:RimJ/RimL family protein N-acetyltransferase
MGPVRTPEPVVAGEIVLRPWEPDDAPVLVEAVEDPDIRLWYQVRLVMEHGLDGARQWCELRADWSDGSSASWAITLAGEVVGSIALQKIDFEQQNAEVGYMVFPAWRGRRVAPRALEAASRFGFDTLGLVRIQLFHAVENEVSCRVAERAGYRLEGKHRKSFRFGDGELHDEHCHARLATDAPGES